MLVKPTCSMICLWEIIENVGKTNNFHDFRETSKAGAIVLRVMEMVVLVFMLLNQRADLGTGGGYHIHIYMYVQVYIHMLV